MKKIFKVSLGALFAAIPVMAGAANVDLSSATGKGHIEATDYNKAVSVSYVKGAYNDLGETINTKQDQLKYGDTAVSSAVSSAVRTTGADNTTLVTEKAVRDAITTAVSDAGTAATSAINALDATVSQTASTDGLAITVVQEDGKLKSVTGSIAANTYDAYGAATSAVNALSATVSQTTGDINISVAEESGVLTSVSANIIAGAVTSTKIADDAVTSAKIADNAVTSAAIATGAVTTTEILDGTIVLGDINSDAMKGTTTSGFSGLTQLTTQGYVDEKVSSANSDKATKTGVENLINSATFNLSNAAVTGSVTAMSEWGTSATSAIQMTGSVTNTAVKADSATVSYTTANPSA